MRAPSFFASRRILPLPCSSVKSRDLVKVCTGFLVLRLRPTAILCVQYRNSFGGQHESFQPATVPDFVDFMPVDTVPAREYQQVCAQLYRTSLPFFRARTSKTARSEEHTSELQSQSNLVCRLLLEKKKTNRRHSQPL